MNSNDLSPSENKVDSAVTSAVRFGFVSKKHEFKKMKGKEKREEHM